MYYIVTGASPFASMRLFESITGERTDRWLVRTVGLLAVAIGTTLSVSALRRRPSLETHVLAISAALSFAAVDVIYAARRELSPVYLLDDAVEIGFVLTLLRTSSPLAR